MAFLSTFVGVGKYADPDVSVKFRDSFHEGTMLAENPKPESRRYGHIGQSSQRQAVNALNEAGFQGDGAQNWAQSQKPRVPQLPN
jgi:hypothetical protein